MSHAQFLVIVVAVLGLGLVAMVWVNENNKARLEKDKDQLRYALADLRATRQRFAWMIMNELVILLRSDGVGAMTQRKRLVDAFREMLSFYEWREKEFLREVANVLRTHADDIEGDRSAAGAYEILLGLAADVDEIAKRTQ